MKKETIVIIALIGLILIILGIVHNEVEIRNCIESGQSEKFCRYAGE